MCGISSQLGEHRMRTKYNDIDKANLAYRKPVSYTHLYHICCVDTEEDQHDLCRFYPCSNLSQTIMLLQPDVPRMEHDFTGVVAPDVTENEKIGPKNRADDIKKMCIRDRD